MLPLTWGSQPELSMYTWITKSHSFPVHVNETQAPLLSSKAVLSADRYHLPLASERVTARRGYSGEGNYYFTCASIAQSHFPS